jgi:hypothetical protein
MSELGWIDFSSTDRERVAQLLAMLAEPGTLDELGIGQIRDAFSESLFPGFSTIQTRARYLIAVPQIFQDYFNLPRKERSRTPLTAYLREAEHRLAQHLVDNHADQESDELGIIGRTLVGKGGASRLPSSIYWNGLRQLELVRSKKSLTEFCRQAYDSEHAVLLADLHEEGNDATDAARVRKVVKTGPEYGAQWMVNARIPLTQREATFLQTHIRHAPAMRNSVPAQLIEHGLLSDALGGSYGTFAQLSGWLKQEDKMSPACRRALALAQDFSHVMEGAQLRLDCLIARRFDDAEPIRACEAAYAQWREKIDEERVLHEDAADQWIAFLPSTVALRPLSKNFVRNWSRLLLAAAPVGELDKAVRQQALDNKKSRSILKRSLDKSFQPGTHALDYRWLQAKRILGDIEEGLAC